jgi:hypothetical protein
MIFRGYPHGSMGLPWVTGSDGRKGSLRGCDGYWNWSPLYSGLFLPQWPLSKFGRHENGGFTPRNCKNMLLIITTCCFPSTFRQHRILRIWLQPYAAGVVCFFLIPWPTWWVLWVQNPPSLVLRPAIGTPQSCNSNWQQDDVVTFRRHDNGAQWEILWRFELENSSIFLVDFPGNHVWWRVTNGSWGTFFSDVLPKCESLNWMV